MAQGAASEAVAYSKLRRLSGRKKSLFCAGVKIGDSALFYKAVKGRSAPRWRGPAKIPDIDETGVAAKFQSLTFKVVGYRVRKGEETQDVGEVDWNPASGKSDQWDGVPLEATSKTYNYEEIPLGEGENVTVTSTDVSHGPPSSPRPVPIPAPPALSKPLPGSPSRSIEHPPPA